MLTCLKISGAGGAAWCKLLKELRNQSEDSCEIYLGETWHSHLTKSFIALNIRASFPKDRDTFESCGFLYLVASAPKSPQNSSKILKGKPQDLPRHGVFKPLIHKLGPRWSKGLSAKMIYPLSRFFNHQFSNMRILQISVDFA